MKPSILSDLLSQTDTQQTLAVQDYLLILYQRLAQRLPSVYAISWDTPCLLSLHQRLAQLQQQVNQSCKRPQCTSKRLDNPPLSDQSLHTPAGSKAKPTGKRVVRNISSYNIADVGYHYIGLRVLSGLPATAGRKEQEATISRSVLKYVSDRALRLLLPEPRGTFQTIGEKICRELVHFQIAFPSQRGYELTKFGKEILDLLSGRKYVELRRIMAKIHLETYDNLREIVQKHFEMGCIWRPIVETNKLGKKDYLHKLLEPVFKQESFSVASSVWREFQGKGVKKIEDILREMVLEKILTNVRVREPLFRSITDRLVSLRLLNVRKDSIDNCDFLKSYSPCVSDLPPNVWYTPLRIDLPSGSFITIHFCEPNMANKNLQKEFLKAIDKTFSLLSPQGGYYDLPDVRDLTCEQLRIPEAAFDEGINQLLDSESAPLTMGLSYDRISGRRSPLVRTRGTSQIYNLVRRV